MDLDLEDCYPPDHVPIVPGKTETADHPAADTCLMIDVEDANWEENLHVLYQPLTDFEHLEYRPRF